MLKLRTTSITTVCLLVALNVFADPAQVPASSTDPAISAQAQQQLSQIQQLKQQLFTDLNTGNVDADTFDDKIEMDIADTQIAQAKYYLDQGDRKNAAISALLARKVLQRLYGNPNDPRLVPIYSLLVQIYESDVDIDAPNTEVADAAQAKLYRQMIDRIHAQ